MINQILKPTTALGLLAIAAALGLGPGCGPNPGDTTSGVSFCCTTGDVDTAYFSATADCRTGHRPIAQTDASNDALYQTCNGKPLAVRVNRPPAPVPPGTAAAGGPAPRVMPNPNLTADAAGGNSAASTCLAECPPGARTRRCLDAGAPPPYAGPLAELASAVIRQQTLRIEMALLAQNFRIAGAPFPGGPVVIQGNRLMKSAPAPAALRAPLPALNATARIEISPALEATMERPGNTAVVIRPVSAAKGASIRFLNAVQPGGPHPLDAQAGGRILALESDGARLMMRTPGACVVLPLR